jgi:NADH-quinone oxidoreductase subunit G
MSAQPKSGVAPDLVTIEIDGRELAVPKGSMIIQAADRAGIAIPRFCYHEKLAIAANCRMCLVEVEKSPKPLPACATPVADGMKVFTQSARALSAQRNVMEFLLINHPLDCPICDQGGECELQDLSMGYGRSVSRFAERKRVLTDEDLGPLVATEMTRCIQCTRCVRFMGEIAGTYELGGMDRGENLEIGTWIGKTLESELSGNIIDVCPVGALTNKPFRFRARAWELIARESIGYHDALGSNLWLHTRRGEVLRTVPRDNEAINECWLSDRDRYSHEGLRAADRATRPLVRRDGAWIETDWNEAIRVAAGALRDVPGDAIGALVHPATSNEEGFLVRELLRALGSGHVDHRLRRHDLSDAPHAQPFAMPVAAIDRADVVLLVGCNPRHELPLVNARLRRAAERGARIHVVNPLDFDTTFALAGGVFLAPAAFAARVERLGAGPDDESGRDLVDALSRAGAGLILAGELLVNHPRAAAMRAALAALAHSTGAALDEIPDGANALGLARCGVLPESGALDARSMLATPRQCYLLYGCEPPHDAADGAALQAALHAAASGVAFSAYASDALKQVADVILPIGLVPEIDATLVNADGVVQRVAAGADLPGDARPGWRVLRALGAALALDGFDFVDLAGLRAWLDQRCPGSGAAAAAPSEPAAPTMPGTLRESLGRAAAGLREDSHGARADATSAAAGFERITTTAIYRADPVLRRAAALNAHPLTRGAMVALNPADALALGIGQGGSVTIGNTTLAAAADRRVPRGAAWIESGYAETDLLAPYGTRLDITPATGKA